MTEGSTNHSLLPDNSKLFLKCSLPSSKTTKRTSIIILRANTKTGYVSKETARQTAPVSQSAANPVCSNRLQSSWAVNWAFTLSKSGQTHTRNMFAKKPEGDQFGKGCFPLSRAERARVLPSLAVLQRNTSGPGKWYL